LAVIGVPGGILHRVLTLATLIFSAKASEILLRIVGADSQADTTPSRIVTIRDVRRVRVFIRISQAYGPWLIRPSMIAFT